MSASAVVGSALVADSASVIIVAAVVGAVITTIGGIIQAVLTNSSANRRQKREFQYRGGRKSSMTGTLFLVAVVMVAVAIYVSTRSNDEPKVASGGPAPASTVANVVPTSSRVLPTAQSGAESTTPSSPIALDEASALVTSYLESAISEETEELAWSMLTESRQGDFDGGIEGFRAFWRNIASVTPLEGPTLVSASATRAELAVHLMYKLFQPNRFGVDCTDEVDTFTLVRVNGVLLIDAYAPKSKDCS